MLAPSSMSTYCSVVACCSSARASDVVRFGRFRSSRISAPFAKSVMPNRWMKIVFGPIVANRSRMDLSKPMMSDVMPTMAVMPITMPSTVSPERILLVRTVSNAIPMTSLKRSMRADTSLLPPQRFDGIEASGARCRIKPEEQSDKGRDADAEGHRPRLDGRRNRRRLGDDERDGRAENGAYDAAEHRQHHGFREHLRHDVR